MTRQDQKFKNSGWIVIFYEKVNWIKQTMAPELEVINSMVTHHHISLEAFKVLIGYVKFSKVTSQVVTSANKKVFSSHK